MESILECVEEKVTNKNEIIWNDLWHEVIYWPVTEEQVSIDFSSLSASQWLHMEFFSHTVKIESESSSKTTASIHHLMQVASSKFNLRVKANTDTDSSRMLTSRYCSFVVTIQGCFSNYVWMMHRWWSWIVTSGKKWGDSRTGSDHLVDLYWTYSYWLFNWSSTLSSSFGEVIRKKKLSRTLILFNFLFYPPISFLLYRSKLSA